MEPRVKLEDLDVVVRHRNGRYLAKIPHIGLYATADSLPKAIEALEAKKQSLREELSQAGALDEISAPWSPQQRGTIASLVLFSAKMLILLVVFMVAVVYTGRVFDRRMEEFRQSTKIGGAAFWTSLERQLARAAEPESEMSAAKKQELLANLHTVVERWRPFVHEAQLLFSENPEPRAGNP